MLTSLSPRRSDTSGSRSHRTAARTDGAARPAPGAPAPRPTPMSIFITEQPAPRARPGPAPRSRAPGQGRQVAVRESEKGPRGRHRAEPLPPLGAARGVRPRSLRRGAREPPSPAKRPAQLPRARPATQVPARPPAPRGGAGEAPRRPAESEAGTKSPSGEGGGEPRRTGKSLTGFAGILIIYRLGFILFSEIVSVVIIEGRAEGRLPTDSPGGQPQRQPPAEHFHPPSGGEAVRGAQRS